MDMRVPGAAQHHGGRKPRVNAPMRGAVQTRHELGAWNGPGSAVQRFTLHRARGTMPFPEQEG